MARRWNACVSAMAILALGALAPAAARAETKTIAVTGQSAPGSGGGTFDDLSYGIPVLNASGQVAFEASLTGTSDGSVQGIFRCDGSTTTAIVRDTRPAPGTGGGTVQYVTGPALNDSGQVAYFAGLTGTTDGSSNGIFLCDGSTTTAIAREKGSAPAMGGGTGNGAFSGFGDPVLDPSGQVAFYVTLTGSSDGSIEGLFRNDYWGLTAVIRTKTSAPAPGGGTFSSLSFADCTLIDAFSQVAFLAGLTGASDGSIEGIFLGNGWGTTTIAREKGSAPGTGGGKFGSFAPPALNASGQVAFQASLTGTSDGSSSGVFRGDGSTLTAIAREGWAAPGAGGGTFSNVVHPALNASGQVAFWATMTGTSIGNAEGIFRGDGSALVAIAREGWAAPGAAGGTFYSFDDPAINAGGQVAFHGHLAGVPGGNGYDYGIFLADDQERIVVVRTGDALQGSTVTYPTFTGGADPGGRSSLNDYGQIAYTATLADGRTGDFLFTPELHWRITWSGSWDTAANWTVGLTPALVHPVLIDPSSSLTVTGPTLAVTIKSLTVGATTYGQTATLNLTSPTGVLTVSGAATIQAAGSVYVSGGQLVAASLTNSGTFFVDVAGAASLGSLLNTGAATVGGAVTVSGTAENDATMTVQTAGVLTATSGLTNLGSLTLSNATLAGGTVTNDYGGAMNAKGTIATTLVNNGALALTGVLTTTGLVTNRGTLSASAGQNLRQNGGLNNYGDIALSGGAVSGTGVLNNFGTIELAGGALSGTGMVTNQAGSLLSGGGTVSAPFANQGGIEVSSFSTLTITQPFTNSGDISLLGPSSVLSGGTVTNTGTIRGLGQGRVGSPVTNSAGGDLRAESGILTLGGTTANAVGGILEILDSATLLVSKGLATNSGSVILRGGTLDNNGHPMTNAGSIIGYGTLRTGGLSNSIGKNLGTGGGDLDVIGAVTNDGTITTQPGCITRFYGAVNGNGSFPGTGTVVFLSGYSPGHSPAEAEFGGDLSIGGSGSLVMELAGTTRGAQYDSIQVDGTLALGGLLDVELLYGYMPEYGATYDVLSWGSRVGTFDAVELPALSGGLAWDSSALYDTGTLTVMPEPATLALVALGGLAAMARLVRKRG